MAIRQLMIDGQIAADAEEIADILGYPSLEHYVMELLAQDIAEKQDMVCMAHAVMDNREKSHEEE